MYSDPLMRSSAAFALGELTHLITREQLYEQWKHNRTEVKSFLAELQESVPMLVRLLKDPEPSVRRHAVIALGKMRDRAALLPLIDSVDPRQEDFSFVQDVAQAIRLIGSHRLVREVLEKFS